MADREFELLKNIPASAGDIIRTRRSIIGGIAVAAIAAASGACGGQTTSPVANSPEAARTSSPVETQPPPSLSKSPEQRVDSTARTEPPMLTPTASLAVSESTSAAVAESPVISPTIAAAVPSPSPIEVADPSPTPESEAVEAEAAAESTRDDASSIPSAVPYMPANRQSILDRYKADAARAEVVLASGRPVVLVTDAIW